METDFANWLGEEIKARGWDLAEFARRARITPPQVSRVLSGTRGPGLDFYRGVAAALGMPLEEVFRKAGVLPAYTELPDEAKSWGERLLLLSPERRELTIAAMENVLRLAEDRPAARRGR